MYNSIREYFEITQQLPNAFPSYKYSYIMESTYSVHELLTVMVVILVTHLPYLI